MIALLQRLESEERDPFWRQVAESARRNVSGKSRDAAMGDNLLWLAQAYPQSRIIVWTHNNHALTDANVYFGSSDPVIGEQTREISARSEPPGHIWAKRRGAHLATISMRSRR